MRASPAASTATPWITVHRAAAPGGPAPRRRLVCFPHAGGTAGFYRDWADRLPADCALWAVQYPGRENRIDEPCLDDMSVLAAHLTEVLLPRADVPLTLFGHSMGASVAHEVARRLTAHRPGSVHHLIVSARQGPSRQPAVPPGQMTHLLPDDGVVAALRALGGDVRALADPDLRAVLLPAIRADHRLIESYRPAPGVRLRTDITALAATDDPSAPVTDVAAWAEATHGSFALHTFPGGHFYLAEHRAAVIEAITRALG
ncbi:thioesterase II family protein [Streptomyces gamaensis]|uniref:Thioesterase II family protein n=1 Tax=Streptomyces gamaensis TaxID=1763542 RepID=A0ABW0Z2D1_9ACTN